MKRTLKCVFVAILYIYSLALRFRQLLTSHIVEPVLSGRNGFRSTGERWVFFLKDIDIARDGCTPIGTVLADGTKRDGSRSQVRHDVFQGINSCIGCYLAFGVLFPRNGIAAVGGIDDI